ncbi:leucyl/phenylalanyl-tRNA--protein transferase [Orbus hercynius]|uniref:Leucyl/phenylalanyl-tRNA--protein transferase n=1 Tax=Orbus hercynius TaxID=593135 RepID=A0A495RCG7_9GAMM|nr:leucyl/phenylalanyl-tRNA--protein transferase [Orbus hercynius]RKS85163.1 leucyl/phenylalanyl-tRNA--protein transferase [Orbus hercynius]
MLLHVLDHSLTFPKPSHALTDPNGLLAVGGDLSANRLLAAYQKGIFPWFSEDEPILWWSPDPRAVLEPEQFHANRTFRKFLNKCAYQVTLNQHFAAVIEGCATYHQDTWITDEMIAAYIQLHQLGFAHSIEVWHNNRLIGGMYGIAQGALFCGESMFSIQTNASKVGLYAFCQHFLSNGGKLIDCQVLNEHTASLGAKDISRDDYLSRLPQLQTEPVAKHCYRQQMIAY